MGKEQLVERKFVERLQKHISGTFSITEPHEPQELEVYLHSDTCNAYHMKGVFLKLEIGTVLTKPV